MTYFANDAIPPLLRETKTIAVVGMSDKPHRDSHRIGEYLMRKGYTVYPVNPTISEVLGLKAYARVADIPEPVDLVDVFRRSEELPQVVEDAIAAGAKALWTQFGVVHEEAADQARAAGLKVVMDRCILVEHQRLPASPATP
jgi:predicted CoA-binding protein